MLFYKIYYKHFWDVMTLIVWFGKFWLAFYLLHVIPNIRIKYNQSGSFYPISSLKKNLFRFLKNCSLEKTKSQNRRLRQRKKLTRTFKKENYESFTSISCNFTFGCGWNWGTSNYENEWTRQCVFYKILPAIKLDAPCGYSW